MWVSTDCENCGIFEVYGYLRNILGYLEVKKDYSYKKTGDNTDGGAQCVSQSGYVGVNRLWEFECWLQLSSTHTLSTILSRPVVQVVLSCATA